MIANLFWSVIHLTPISVFCYTYMNSTLFYIFLITSLLPVLLPYSFFNTIQLSTSTAVYKKIGVKFINKFTQNGDVINRLIRKTYPQYKVISTKRSSAAKLIRQTYMFEKFHFMMFLFFAMVSFYACIENCFIWTVAISISNLLYNVYPNLLQQYIRIRLTSGIKIK